MLNDSQRLAKNQRILLDSMPEAVILVNEEGVIQQANPAGASFLEQHRWHAKGSNFEKIFSQLIFSFLNNNPSDEPFYLEINHKQYSVHIAQFQGYKGEQLFWVIAKDEPPSHNAVSSRQVQPNSQPLIGSSRIMRELHDNIMTVANTDATVMISGESGTGKELVANLLHQHSTRKDAPFLAINCNALNDAILESELFGYEKGAFTGAVSKQIGKFESCNNGTIFLDEIGDISPRMQGMLLRILQNGEILRVGASSTTKVDVRIIAATNRDLAEDVQTGRFRIDLFYRLNIIRLQVPPLRKRQQDIIELATFFAQKYATIARRNVRLSNHAKSRLLQPYEWPGNVRELENVIHRATLLCKSETIEAEDLSFDFPRPNKESSPSFSFEEAVEDLYEAPLKNILNQVEKEIIISKLRNNGGNVADTAEKLSICKAALYEKMRRFEISPKALR